MAKARMSLQGLFRTKAAVEAFERQRQPQRVQTGSGDAAPRHTNTIRVTSTTPTSGRYPGKLQFFDREAGTWSDGNDCWLVEINGSTLAAQRYHACEFRGFLAATGLAVFTVAKAGSGGFTARKNSAGTTFGPRSRLNLIEGTGVTLTMGDDAGNDEIDVTVAASAASWSGADVDITSGQTINHNTQTAVQWENENLDSGGYFTGASNTRFTVPAGGMYLLCANILWSTSSTSGVLQAGYQINGVGGVVKYVEGPHNNIAQTVTFVMELDGSNYVEVLVYHTHSGTLSAGIAAGSTWNITFLGS